MTVIVDVDMFRLLRNGHLGGRRGIMPVLIHGDLWYRNKAYGFNPAWEMVQDVVFDLSDFIVIQNTRSVSCVVLGGFQLISFTNLIIWCLRKSRFTNVKIGSSFMICKLDFWFYRVV